MHKKNSKLGIFFALFSETLFGLSFLFTKNITGSVSPFTLLSWRFFLAFLAINLCVFFKILKVNFKGKDLKPLFLLALVQPILYFTFETFGIQMTTASESGLIISCIPVMALVCSTLFLKEKPTKFQLWGIIITTIGVFFIVIIQKNSATFNPLGYVSLFAAVTSAGLYFVLVQRNTHFNDAEKTYAIMASGAFFFTVIALFKHGQQGSIQHFLLLPFIDGNFLVAILYLGIGSSVLAFFFANAAISCLGTNRSASFIGIATLVSVLSGVLILKESFSWGHLLGMIMIIIGVYIANLPSKTHAP